MAGNNTVILSFSGRKNGNCEQIARRIQSLTGGTAYCFSGMKIHPCSGCNYECFSCGADCPHTDDVKTLYEAVLHSDRAIYILPNYCDFPNALFFAFNERSLCVFSKREDLLEAYGKIPKQFIVVSGDEPDSFRTALSQHCEGEPEILFLSAKTYGKKSINGDLMTSSEAAAAIDAFIHNKASID